jgi:hypothetical protein
MPKGEMGGGPYTFLFVCAVCEREVRDFPCRNGRDRHLPPLCRYCEGHYSDQAPNGGAFMDRRKAIQISALAEALHGNAGSLKWRQDHASP